MSARDLPAHEDADDCSKPCLCRECKSDLSDAERRRKRYRDRVACGCFLCREGLFVLAREA